MSESNGSGLNPETLIDQMFELWILPHIEASNLAITRGEVTRALIVLHPRGVPEVMLNKQAELIATVKVRDDVAEGELVTLGNVEGISDMHPAHIDPDAGWIAFAFIADGRGAVAFDFRYNRNRALALLDRASDFMATAREALIAGRTGPAVENALAAGELAVTALTSLQNTTHKGRNSHSARQSWLNMYAHNGNGQLDWYQAMRKLLQVRPFARYGDPQASPLPSESELADCLDHVNNLIEHVAQHAADHRAASS
ncbi:HEPN domain-containing protein [Nocardia beijingensis]|uniref:HEPN domain-containing protein n=1 Tax=Nocardia beijingensis TaxID=95162 RepID=A0ABW7W795_9NOCA